LEDLFVIIHKTSPEKVTIKKFDGKDFLIAPVVAIKEGVLNNSLITGEEIGRFVDAWNGRPLPVNHPVKANRPISANSPDVIEKQVIGQFFNAEFDGLTLKGDLFIDIEKAERLGGEAKQSLDKLRNGDPLEVSTAYFAEVISQSGTFKGRQYNSVQTKIAPDHLALLPNDIGACSFKDGCGAPRVNWDELGEEKDQGDKLEKIEVENEEKLNSLFNQLKSLLGLKSGCGCNRKTINLEKCPRCNSSHDSLDFTEVHDVPYKESIFWALCPNNNQPILKSIENNTEENDSEEVLNNSDEEESEENNKDDMEVNENMDKEKLVDAIIESEDNPFTNDDRDNLLAFSEDKLKFYLSENEDESEVEENKDESKADEELESNESDEDEVESNKDETDEEEKAVINVEDFADEELREFLVQSRQEMRNRKAAIIKTIVDNKSNAFTKDELETWSFGQLQKLADSLKVDVDYSANAGSVTNRSEKKRTGPPAPKPCLLDEPFEKDFRVKK